jgi:tripartite-type tricarboxylate transporter receptor subunit TctC
MIVVTLLCIASGVSQAAYPTRPIRVIVPFPAGGGADTLARLIMAKVSEKIGAPIVIVNRAGAGGNIGVAEAARAENDGYTLVYGTNGTHAANHALYPNPGFDPLQDFEPISRLTEISLMVVVHPAVQVSTLKELRERAMLATEPVLAATAGQGTTSHLAAEIFRYVTAGNVSRVHYRGGAAAVNDLIGGHVQMMIEVMPSAAPPVTSRQLRALAVTSTARWPSAPDIPTVAEAGMPELSITAWDGLFAPTGTPQAIVTLLNRTVTSVLSESAMADALLARGARPTPSTSEDLRTHIRTQLLYWRHMVELTGANVAN